MTTSPAIGARSRSVAYFTGATPASFPHAGLFDYTRRGSGASPVALAGEHHFRDATNMVFADATVCDSRGIGPRTDARLGRGTSHVQQTGLGVGPYYLGHALSRPQQLGSTAEGRRASVAG